MKRLIAGLLGVGALVAACQKVPPVPTVQTSAGGAASLGGAASSNGGSGGTSGSSATAGSGGRGGAGLAGAGGTVMTCGEAGAAGDDGLGGNAGAPGELAVVQVEASHFTTCALLNTGRIRCWGQHAGAMGYGFVFDSTSPGSPTNRYSTIGDDETPASMGDIPLAPKAERIANNAGTLCAFLAGGRVRCLEGAHASCANDLELGGEVAQLSGYAHTCAVLSGGVLRCWGGGGSGQQGYGSTEHILDPTSAGDVPVGGPVKQVTTGTAHTCALLTNGSVRCWGDGSYGELGYGNTESVGKTPDTLPEHAGDVDVGGEVQQIVAGNNHTCALLTTGNVRCWGYGYYGQLGYGNAQSIGDNETPASAGDVDVGGPVKQLALGINRTCALLTTGKVRCWGRAGNSGLGYGNTNDIGDNETPASAGDIDVGGEVSQITMGASHVCALLTTGRVRCWGSNNYGQLGYGHRNRIGEDETPASAGDVPVF